MIYNSCYGKAFERTLAPYVPSRLTYIIQ